MPDPTVTARLTAAAAHLLHVGRGDLDIIDTTASLACLHARVMLDAAGAQPTPSALDGIVASPAEARTAIHAALGELAQLPADVFRQSAILDASAACHDALDALA